MKIKHWLMSFLLLKIIKDCQKFFHTSISQRVIEASDNDYLIDHKPNDNRMLMITQIPTNLAFQNFSFS